MTVSYPPLLTKFVEDVSDPIYLLVVPRETGK